MRKIFDGFKNFIFRGNALDLAVGVVIGASFNGLINSFVKDLITPLIGAVVNTSDFSNLSFVLNGSKFNYGDFISTAVSFFLVAAVIYFFVMLPMNAIMFKAKKPKLPTTKICPECISEIPKEARRCSHCGQLVK